MTIVITIVKTSALSSLSFPPDGYLIERRSLKSGAKKSDITAFRASSTSSFQLLSRNASVRYAPYLHDRHKAGVAPLWYRLGCTVLRVCATPKRSPGGSRFRPANEIRLIIRAAVACILRHLRIILRVPQQQLAATIKKWLEVEIVRSHEPTIHRGCATIVTNNV